MPDVTRADAMLAVAEEGGPKSAAFLTKVFDAQDAALRASQPTWGQLEDRARKEYERGFRDGQAVAEERAMQRLRSLLFPTYYEEE